MASAKDQLFVANCHDDSISVIDLKSARSVRTISLGPIGKLTAADRGELLFFDARVSHGGWMSCHSCHTDGHSNHQLTDTLGDGGYGAPKRVPSLLGTKGTAPWAWNGSAKSLPEQVQKSVQTTMHSARMSEQKISDIVAFLEQLPPPPSSAKPVRRQIDRGRKIFASQGCVQCHQPPTYTSSNTFDVKLVDESGLRLFNPPSLRGVSQRDALFHDGRHANLETLIRQARHQLTQPLEEDDIEALLAFLKSL